MALLRFRGARLPLNVYYHNGPSNLWAVRPVRLIFPLTNDLGLFKGESVYGGPWYFNLINQVL